MHTTQIRLTDKMALTIETVSKETGRSKSEVVRGFIEAGMVKSATSNGSASVYDALQIFKSDLISDLKRAIPASAPEPTPSVMTQKIDLTELKSELVSELRQVLATTRTAQPQQQDSPTQKGNVNEELRLALEKSTAAIENSSELRQKMVDGYNGQLANFKSIKTDLRAIATTTSQLAEKPDPVMPTGGITRDEFVELVQIVREEIGANRKFQQAATDFIGTSLAQMQSTVSEMVAQSENSEGLKNLSDQIRALESKSRSLFGVLIESSFLARQYTGVTLEKVVANEKEFERLYKDIQGNWEEERKRLNGLI